MDSEENVKQVFKDCVEKILIYCITQNVEFRSSNTYDNKLNPDSIVQLINIYTDRYVKIYNKYFRYNNNIDEDNYTNIMNKFIRKIGIVRIMYDNNRDDIEKIIEKSINQLTNNISNLEVGTCYFCQGECNPMSQSCGQCAREVSGIALGIYSQKHLEQFM